MSKIAFSPIQDTFALEVTGENLHRPDQEQIAAMKREWASAGVLVFRRLALSTSELLDFSKHFGTPETVIRKDWLARNSSHVTIMTNMLDGSGKGIGMPGTRDVFWHTDQSYMPKPATGAVLQAIEVPEKGGSTYWVNLQAAYDRLPQDLAKIVEDKHAIYDYEERLKRYDPKNRVMSEEVRKSIPPPITHPLVNVHPVTGKKCLYFDPSTTSGVVGMSDEDGRELLAELARIATAEDQVYRHDWRLGDVVMWDNAFLLHRRDEFDGADVRFMKRTTLTLPEETHITLQGSPL